MHELSVTENVRMFMLAPSTHLDAESFIAVVGDLCGMPCVQVTDTRKIRYSQQPLTQHPPTDTRSSKSHDHHRFDENLPTIFEETMLNLRDKEACGIPFLACLLWS